MDKVDILLPPEFNKSGVVKTREQAISNGDWLGGFHLWVIRTKPQPALLFQRRSPKKPTFPNLLDVSAAGHYLAGENVKDGLREVKEEIGKNYDFNQLTYLGKKIFVDFDRQGRKLQTVNDVFFTIDNSPLSTFTLQKQEVASLLIIPLSDLKAVFTKANYQFVSSGILQNHQPITDKISKSNFVKNWDHYQYKIALLSEKFIAGERNLLY